MKVAKIAVFVAMMSGVSNANAFAELVQLGKAEFNSTINIKKECSMTVEKAGGGIYIPSFNDLETLDFGRINFKTNSPATIQIAASKVFTNAAPWGNPTITPDIELFLRDSNNEETEIKGVRTDIPLTASSSGKTFSLYPLVRSIPSAAGDGAIKTTLTVSCNVL